MGSGPYFLESHHGPLMSEDDIALWQQAGNDVTWKTHDYASVNKSAMIKNAFSECLQTQVTSSFCNLGTEDGMTLVLECRRL